MVVLDRMIEALGVWRVNALERKSMVVIIMRLSSNVRFLSPVCKVVVHLFLAKHYFTIK